MDWQNVIKNKPQRSGEQSMVILEEYFESTPEYNWSIKFTNRRGELFFTAKPSTGTSLKVKGIVPLIPLDGYITPNDLIDEAVLNLKPSFRSLDWLLETTIPIDDIELPEVGNNEWQQGVIVVKAISGSEYTIDTTALKSSGCYRVESEEGWYICIEMQANKPVGDNVLGLVLGLYNDENTRHELEGIDQYLDRELEVSCEVCDEYVTMQLSESTFTCPECDASMIVDDISFEPAATFSINVLGVTGPDGWIEGHDLPAMYLSDGLFFQDNKTFRLEEPSDYNITVRNSPNDPIYDTEVEGIYNSEDGDLYDEDGYELEVSEVYESIKDMVDAMKFFDKYTNYDIEGVYDALGYDNIEGSLWSDGESFLDRSGEINTIDDIYNATGMGEEHFLTLSPILVYVVSPDEILDYFGYTNAGDYWSKDGEYYVVDGSDIKQIDETEITKNLSSKAVLPINMKWTDYLKKTSDEESSDWESALKSFISDGKKLGIPLSVMELLKLAKEATTSQSEGFETLHRPTFSEEEEEDV